MTEGDRAAPANPTLGSRDTLRASLSDADDRLLVNLDAPQRGIAPRIRIGRRWINTLWGFPIGAAALLCLIAIAQSLRELPSVTAFIQRLPLEQDGRFVVRNKRIKSIGPFPAREVSLAELSKTIAPLLTCGTLMFTVVRTDKTGED